jgi:hypothetical protein
MLRFELAGITNPLHMVALAGQYLNPPAKDSYLSMKAAQRLPTSLTELAERFRAEFEAVDRKSVARRNLLSLQPPRKGDVLSFNAYVRRNYTALRLVGPDDETQLMVLEKYLQCLPSPLQDQVIAHMPGSLEEALNLAANITQRAKSYKSNVWAGGNGRHYGQQGAPARTSSSGDTATPMELGVMGRGSTKTPGVKGSGHKQQRYANVRCYHCQEKGHIALHCPKRLAGKPPTKQ